MKTSDERREVAERLRELRHRTYYREEIAESICDALSIADPVNTFREPEDVYKLLADLIDPTCHDAEYGETDGFTCSECGEWTQLVEPSFCPHCGARVVGGNG